MTNGSKCFYAAYTNNEINSGKNHESYTCFSAVVEGQHDGKIDDISIWQILF